MLQLELPHINVLSKIDILSQYGDLGAWVFEDTGTEALTTA